MKDNKKQATNEAEKPIAVPNIEVTSLPPTEPTSQEFEKRYKMLFLSGIIFLAFITLSTVAILILASKMPPNEKTITTVELEVKTPAVQKEKKTAFDKSEWTFEVLNGSGVAGRAGSAAQKLEKLGFTVVKIGNAGNQTYTTTELSVAKDKFDQTNLLLEDLKTEFPTATLSGELILDSTASARLVVGKE